MLADEMLGDESDSSRQEQCLELRAILRDESNSYK